MQYPKVQLFELQSESWLQLLPSPHFWHEPPQSVSVSSPSLVPLPQWAGRQLAFWQTPVAQSEPALQYFPSAQRGQPDAPPQSTSVSAPFFTPSLQAGTAQLWFAGQTPDWQSAATLQVVPLAHF